MTPMLNGKEKERKNIKDKTMFGYWKVWRKMWEQKNREKKWRKIKNRFKANKLFLYIILKKFHGFNSSIYRLNNLKIYKFLNNFNYI